MLCLHGQPCQSEAISGSVRDDLDITQDEFVWSCYGTMPPVSFVRALQIVIQDVRSGKVKACVQFRTKLAAETTVHPSDQANEPPQMHPVPTYSAPKSWLFGRSTPCVTGKTPTTYPVRSS